MATSVTLTLRLRRLLVVAAVVLAGCAGHTEAARAAAPVTRSELAAAVRSQTGLSPSQVTAAPVCEAPAPGHVGCQALELVNARTGAPVRPRVHSDAHAQAVSDFGPAALTVDPAAQAGTGAGTPAYLQQAYDLAWLSSVNGAGTTIAVIDVYDDPTAATDMANFRTTYGLPACTAVGNCFRKLNQDGQTSSYPAADDSVDAETWAAEESLDLDAISSLCPLCHIVLVEADSTGWSDVQAAAQTGVAAGATILSESFSGEQAQAPGGSFTYPGVATLAATGDNGYLAPEPGGAPDNAYPAALPGVTAVGGTTLAAASSSARGYAESAWSLSGGEGGGSGCDTTQPKPSYQTDSGCTGRAYADVSADADPDTGLQVYDSQPHPGGGTGWIELGGTSLATPLAAAFEAVTGVAGTTPAWAYADESMLNDPTSGTTGLCPAAITYICTAGVGYDGPTGAGSISGDVTAGRPGIGGSAVGTVGDDSGVVTGGLNPNGLATSYYWQYGTTTAYGDVTPAVAVGAGEAYEPVSTQLTGLASDTSYDAQLVATNADGITDGPVVTFVTGAAQTPPSPTAVPSLAGLPEPTQVLTTDGGQWTDADSETVQWQYEPPGGSSFGDISGATADSYTPTGDQVGGEVLAQVTAHNQAGSTTDVSPPDAVLPLTAPVNLAAPTIYGDALVGDALSAREGTWAPTGTITYQWQQAPVPAGPFTDLPGATGSTHVLTDGDAGTAVRALVTVSDAAGVTSQPSPAITVPAAATTATTTTTTTTAAATTTATTPATTTVAPVFTTPTTSPTTTIAAAPRVTTGPVLSGTPAVGSTLSLRAGHYANGTVTQVGFYRCLFTCAAVARGERYRLTAGDAGTFVQARVQIAGPGGQLTATTAVVGPVTGPTVSIARVAAGRRIDLTLHGAAVLTASATQIQSRTVVTLSRRTSSPVAATLCVVSGAAIPSCTKPRRIRRTVRLTVTLNGTDALDVIASR